MGKPIENNEVLRVSVELTTGGNGFTPRRTQHAVISVNRFYRKPRGRKVLEHTVHSFVGEGAYSGWFIVGIEG